MSNEKNTSPAYKTFVFDVEWHAKIIGFIVGLSMIAVYSWIIAGFFNLFVILYHSFPDNWSHGSETMIKDIVIILASLELIRIFQSYLILGRVKVTFILDVTLVVLIGELISFWYRESQTTEVLSSIGIITVLVLLRIITSKYSPEENK